jgi:ubiquinone/menaquinone biosynthesis C-methylase UbiE
MSFWEIYSHFYDLSLRNWFPYKRLLEDLNNTLEIKEGEGILDAGCGPGFVIEKAIKENTGKRISVVGLDFSRGMIKRARKRCKNFSNVKLQVADLNKNLEFPDNSFDKVVCSNTLYALENPQRVISEFYRVLKPGAAVIIANPKPNAGEKELIREHLTALKKLTPIYKKIYHILTFVLLIPVNFVVIIINKIIIKKAKSREYHFIDKENLQRILQEVGFKNINISSCYADQNWLVRAEKSKYGQNR